MRVFGIQIIRVNNHESNGVKNQLPPSWAKRFLSWYCRPELLEDLEGDLNEFFFRHCETRGWLFARLMYIVDVIKFCRPYTIGKPKSFHPGVQGDLLKIYSIGAFRNFLKTKLSTALSVISLTLGLACFMLICLYVFNEFSFNRHYENHERIGRVSLNLVDQRSKEETNLVWSNPQLPDELRESYPEIEAATGILKLDGKAVVKKEGSVFLEEDFFTVDKYYTHVFSHEWLAGDKTTALSEPASVVLTETLAIKYFAGQQPLNKILTINDRDYRVSGVIKDVPFNTDLRVKALLSLDSHFPDWCMTYILLKDQQSMGGFQQKLNAHFDAYLRPVLEQTGSDGSYHFEALTDIHLGDRRLFDTPKASRLILFVFLSIAFLVLAVTVVNYLTIAVARAVKRFTDVGVRKVFGALPGQIKLQYIVETFWLAFASFILSLLIIFYTVPVLRENHILDFYPEQWISFNFLLLGLAFIVLLSLVAGRFPGVLANKGSTLSKLKGRSVIGMGKFFHPGFMAIHLTVTLSLIFSTKVVRNQMDALLTTDPGYDTKQILVVDIPTDTTVFPLLDHLKTSLARLSFVSNVSLAGPYSTPTNDVGFDIFTVDAGNHESWKAIDYIRVDDDYFDLFNIQLIQGTTFKQSDASPDRYDKVVVNEALVKAMGWENPLEEYISNNEVAGVVQNFNFYGLQLKAEPMIFRLNSDFPEKLLIKFNEVTKPNLQTLKNVWADNIKGHPFSYRFLDDYFEQHLEREYTLKNLLMIFSFLASLIACVGLFASINVRVEQSMKETGIRRMLGAGVLQLLSRSFREYVIGIMIASLVAFPLTVFMLTGWLEKFAYKTAIDMATCLESVLIISALGSVAILYQAIRILKIKPLECIRYE